MTEIAEPPLLKGVEFYLYILELVGVGVKVGISANPQNRLGRHRKVARDHNVECGRVWISEPHQEARLNERRLIALGGEKNRREYVGVSFDQALEATCDLSMTRVDGAVRRARIESEANYVSFFWPAGTTKADIRRTVEEVFGR